MVAQKRCANTNANRENTQEITNMLLQGQKKYSVYYNAKEVSQTVTEISDDRTGMKEKKMFVENKILIQ